MDSNRILLIALVPLFLFSACSINEPEPYYNKIPDEEHIASISVQDIESYQHFAGLIIINFSVDSLNFPVDKAIFSLDNTILQEWDNPPYEFNLDTRDWQDGEHQITLELVSGDMGIASLIGLPTIVHSVPVVFDQTPPTPVTLESVNWDNDHPRLNWTQNTDPNFYCYYVIQYNSIIDTICESTTTSFLDTEIEQVFGSEVASYSILVSNNDSTAESNTQQIGFGETLDVNSAYNISPLASQTKDEIYVIDSSEHDLYVISTIDHSIITQIHINIYLEEFQGLCMSLDEDVLFSWTDDNIYRLNETTYENELYYDIGYGSKIFGREERFYTRSGHLFGYNPLTGETFGWDLELLYYYNVGSVSFAIQSDGNLLYAVDPYVPSFPYEAATIYTIDISVDDSLNIVAEQQANVGTMKLTSDDQFLIFHDRHNNIEKWDALTLEFIDEINLPNSSGFPTDGGFQDLFLTQEYFYVAFRLYQNSQNDAGQVLKYQIDNLNLVNSWDFRYYPETIVVSRDESVMYVFTHQDPFGFIVPLN